MTERTDVVTEDLAAMYDQGMSIVQIATSVGMASTSIWNRLTKSGKILRPQPEAALAAHLRHGHARAGKHSKIYDIYRSMVVRCTEPRCESYCNYGGRGITVCGRWLGDAGFLNFLSDMKDRPRGKSLERRDNHGPYSPENCYWATPAQQSRNKRNNIILSHGGREMCVADWAVELGMSAFTIYKRLSKGFSVERALSVQHFKTGPRARRK